MLEDREGVLVAMPFCDEGRVTVWARPGALTEQAAREAVESDEELVLSRFARRGQP